MSTPHDDVLTRLRDVRGGENGQYSARCPAHANRRKRLSVRIKPNGRVLLNCQAGCAVATIRSKLKLKRKDLRPRKKGLRSPKRRMRKRWRTSFAHFAVDDLAHYTCLSFFFLRSQGVENRPNRTVRIRYRLRNGSDAPRHRIRAARRARDGSYWERGRGEIVPHGLERLGKIDGPFECLLVQGEIDSLTASYYGIPALGIPGSHMAGKLKLEHLEGVERILIWRQPDAGGDPFVTGVANQLEKIGFTGEVLVVLPRDATDLNHLHKQFATDPKGFWAEYNAFLDSAVPIEAFRADSEAGGARPPTARESHPALPAASTVSVKRRLTPNTVAKRSPHHRQTRRGGHHG